MALYIPQSILHLARSLYVRPETYGPNYVLESHVQCVFLFHVSVSTVVFRMLKSMLLGAFITLFALWILYIIDEERFHGAQAHAKRVWNVTVAALPLQLVETGQKCKEVSKSTIGFVWSKTEAVYVWVNTNPAVKEYFELGRALLQVLYTNIYDLCRTLNQQCALYVETLKNKIL